MNKVFSTVNIKTNVKIDRVNIPVKTEARKKGEFYVVNRRFNGNWFIYIHEVYEF